MNVALKYMEVIHLKVILIFIEKSICKKLKYFVSFFQIEST